MVSWGMGHNLEKNLERVRSLRARGQLDKALKSLQDWAEKHPDTPHYQFEAGMVAFELKDWATGLNAMRGLMRDVPETREKVLDACREQFDDVPALPLGEFLIENALQDQDLDRAIGLVDRLDEENRGVFLRKLSLRQRSLDAGDVPLAPKVLHGLVVQFLLACSLADGERVRGTIGDLVREAPFPPQAWTRLVEKALKLEPQDTALRMALAQSLAAERRIGSAGEALVHAARLDESAIEDCLSLLHSFEPDDESRGPWYHAEGQLHLLRRDGAAAAESWTHAADAAPKLRETLLDGLARPSENSSLPGREEALKLRLRLLVVQKHFDEIPELARRLVAEGLAQPGELRALLGEGHEDELPTEMIAVLAEIALRDEDIVAAAKFAYDIPTTEEHSCRRLLRTIDSMIDQWEEESRLQLFALRAVLRARMQDRNGANGALAEAWRAYPAETDTLTAVSDRCLQDVRPLPEFAVTALAALLDHGSTEWMVAHFLTLCPGSPAPGSSAPERSGGLNFSGLDSGAYSQDELQLDLGGEEESFVRELGPALVEILREDPRRGPRFLVFFEELDRPDLEPPLRHAIALAALQAGDTGRALPAYALLSMMADPEFLDGVADDYDAAIELHPEDTDLLLARAELHIEGHEFEGAAGVLDRALRLAPGRAGEVVEAFDRMLESADEATTPLLQASLAEALFEVRCFDRLTELCDRVLAQTDGANQVPWLRLKIRMAIARSEFSAALQLIQRAAVKGPMPAAVGAELLEEILAVHPGSSIGWLMLGQLAIRAGSPGRALEAYVEAIRIDPSLEQPVAGQIAEISTAPDADAELLIGIGRFHLGRGAADRAAYAFGRALDLDASVSDRVLGELETRLGQESCPQDLLGVAARACRHAGQPERATQLLLQMESGSPNRIETVLGEFHQLRADYPELVLPASCMAEVLWRQNSAEAAFRLVIEAAAVETCPLRDRIEMLRDFHERPGRTPRLSVALASLLAEEGDRSGASALIEACTADDDFDAAAASEVTGLLHRRFPEDARLAILHHDLLVRCGQVDEALQALPPAAALDEELRRAVLERFDQHRSTVASDADLALRFADALVAEDRVGEAITVLEAAARPDSLPGGHPLLLEWARLLHANGQPERSAAVLVERFRTDEERREAYSSFGRWTAQRLDRQVAVLKGRLDERPDDPDCAMDLADMLLAAERAAEARDLLTPMDRRGALRARRAVLLARAHLLLDQAQDAEAVLLDAIGAVTREHEDFGEIQYRLAECADLLGRHDEATARLRGLLADPRYADSARVRARSSYAHHLSEAAGDRRAVLTAVSSLNPNPSRTQR